MPRMRRSALILVRSMETNLHKYTQSISSSNVCASRAEKNERGGSFPLELVNVAALSLKRRVSLVEQIHQNSERCQCWNRLTWISTCCELASPRSLTFWSFLPNWIWMTMGWLVVSEQRLGNWLICHFCWWTTISWLERFRENLVIWQISNCNFAFQFVQRYHAAVDGIDQRLPWWILAPLSALCGMCYQCYKSKNAAMNSLLHYNL